jgi:hypothetical protein
MGAPFCISRNEGQFWKLRAILQGFTAHMQLLDNDLCLCWDLCRAYAVAQAAVAL